MSKWRWLVLGAGVILTGMAHAILQDPTRPPDFSDNIGVESLRVNAIVYSPSRKIAVINGAPMKENETLSGNHVLEIGPQAVYIEGPGGRISLDLIRQPIKK